MPQIIIETDPAGQRLYETCQSSQQAMAKQLDQLHSWSAMLKVTATHDELNDLFKAAAILAIASGDLSVVASPLYLAKQKTEQIFYMKNACLIIYETYDALKGKFQLFNKEIQEAAPETKTQHELVVKTWRSFLKTYKVDTTLKDIRHRTGGHIDLNFDLWYQTVTQLNTQHISVMLSDFLKLLQELQNLINQLLQRRLFLLLRNANQARANSLALIEKMEADAGGQIDFSFLKKLLLGK